VLATDYDGTLAHHGAVAGETARAIERLRATGRRTVLVTGRIVVDLARVFDRLDLFDLVVAENGAVLFDPARNVERALAEPPPESLKRLLRAREVPFDLGRAILATWEPHEHSVLDAIRELGLGHAVVFNKGAVMVLPQGVNKASGLAAALAELGLTAHEAVGVGDGENDHALVSAAELGVAVGNGVPALKDQADLVTAGSWGDGVRELAERLERDDLADADAPRRDVPLGETAAGRVAFRPGRDRVLFAGGPGSGKTTAVRGLLGRLLDRGYQLCVVDPEGDHEGFAGLTRVGAAGRAPAAEEVLALLADPSISPSVNLLGVKVADRPAWFAALLPRLQELRGRTGRPHVWVGDEAHHLFPRDGQAAPASWPADPGAAIFVTHSPDRLAPAILRSLTGLVTMGEGAGRALASVLETAGLAAVPAPAPGEGEAVSWWRRRPAEASVLRIEPPRAARGPGGTPHWW
jgi:hydroxymethylpyrimidine pyrophosphatase-like HAD family hydrolase